MTSLAERIRTIISDMPGPEYGKQARLARIAGTGRPAVNNWLSSQKNISGEHATKICDALGYRSEWLLFGDGPRWADEQDAAELEAKPSRPSDASPLHELTPARHDELFMVHVNLDEFRLISAYRQKADCRNLLDLMLQLVDRHQGA